MKLNWLKKTRFPLTWQLSQGQNLLKLLANKGKEKAGGLSNPDLEEKTGSIVPEGSRQAGDSEDQAPAPPPPPLHCQAAHAEPELPQESSRQTDRVPSLPGAAG